MLKLRILLVLNLVFWCIFPQNKNMFTTEVEEKGIPVTEEEKQKIMRFLGKFQDISPRHKEFCNNFLEKLNKNFNGFTRDKNLLYYENKRVHLLVPTDYGWQLYCIYLGNDQDSIFRDPSVFFTIPLDEVFPKESCKMGKKFKHLVVTMAKAYILVNHEGKCKLKLSFPKYMLNPGERSFSIKKNINPSEIHSIFKKLLDPNTTVYLICEKNLNTKEVVKKNREIYGILFNNFVKILDNCINLERNKNFNMQLKEKITSLYKEMYFFTDPHNFLCSIERKLFFLLQTSEKQYKLSNIIFLDGYFTCLYDIKCIFSVADLSTYLEKNCKINKIILQKIVDFSEKGTTYVCSDQYIMPTITVDKEVNKYIIKLHFQKPNTKESDVFFVEIPCENVEKMHKILKDLVKMEGDQAFTNKYLKLNYIEDLEAKKKD